MYYKMNFFDVFIYFTLFIKVCYFMTSLVIIIFTHRHNEKYIKKLENMKNVLEFIFMVLISIFLLVSFNPFIKFNIVINDHAKLLLFFYGILVLLNADWELFFKKSNETKVLEILTEDI